MEDTEPACKEEDWALNIAERIGDVVKSGSLELLESRVTKEY